MYKELRNSLNGLKKSFFLNNNDDRDGDVNDLDFDRIPRQRAVIGTHKIPSSLRGEIACPHGCGNVKPLAGFIVAEYGLCSCGNDVFALDDIEINKHNRKTIQNWKTIRNILAGVSCQPVHRPKAKERFSVLIVLVRSCVEWLVAPSPNLRCN